jgi:glycine cleavage system transcriptional repressor
MTTKLKWYMLTLVGKDRPGIVAHVTAALYEGGANLGETSMMRLGGNFTIMMMVQFSGTTHALQDLVGGVAESLGLQLHIDHIEARLHDHRIPDVRITVYGADRAGIVAKVTGVLAEAGLDILELDSDVAGTDAEPIYIMNIEGHAAEGVLALESALDIVRAEGIDASLQPIDTLVG